MQVQTEPLNSSTPLSMYVYKVIRIYITYSALIYTFFQEKNLPA